MLEICTMCPDRWARSVGHYGLATHSAPKKLRSS